jgi:hypothetical protein
MTRHTSSTTSQLRSKSGRRDVIDLSLVMSGEAPCTPRPKIEHVLITFTEIIQCPFDSGIGGGFVGLSTLCPGPMGIDT